MKKMFLRALPIAFVLVGASAANAEAFNGGYAGFGLGVDNFEVKADNVFAEGDNYDGLSANGANFGVYGGYDMPLGDKVFAGLEAELSLSSAKISYDDTIDTLTIKARTSYGLSGRIGAKVSDSTGVYARLGWVSTNFKANLNGYTGSSNDNAIRYGAGLETALSDTMSLRVEYVIADYGDMDTGDVLSVSNGQVKTGLSIRF